MASFVRESHPLDSLPRTLADSHEYWLGRISEVAGFGYREEFSTEESAARFFQIRRVITMMHQSQEKHRDDAVRSRKH